MPRVPHSIEKAHALFRRFFESARSGRERWHLHYHGPNGRDVVSSTASVHDFKDGTIQAQYIRGNRRIGQVVSGAFAEMSCRHSLS